MTDLRDVAPAFVEMAHRIVWCSAATVDGQGRPRSRVLHPIWQSDGKRLEGWVGTEPTPTKREHLEASAFVSVNYWSPSHDTCVAECRAAWGFDDDTRREVWDLFLHGRGPVGYDPASIDGWDGPTGERFAALPLDPWRLRVLPSSALLEQRGAVLSWQE